MSELLTMNMELNCAWNGMKGEGGGLVFHDEAENITGGVFEYDNNPDLGNATLAASCTSIISWVGFIFSSPAKGSMNLFSLIGDSFDVAASFTFFDAQGEPFGEVRQEARLEREEGPEKFSGNIELEGTLDGPADIMRPPDHAGPIRQAPQGLPQGLIEGVYGQTIPCRRDELFHVLSKRQPRSHTGRELPFEEVWSYKLRRVKLCVLDGRRSLDYRASAYYTPLEGEHGSLEAAGLAWDEVLPGVAA